jgi:hypothetical protein
MVFCDLFWSGSRVTSATGKKALNRNDREENRAKYARKKSAFLCELGGSSSRA